MARALNLVAALLFAAALPAAGQPTADLPGRVFESTR
jgi:hypothetical protein